MKKLFITTLLLGGYFSYAQDTEESFEGHYLGLQVNELVRQVLSFNSTNTPSNPYFFNYSYFSQSGGGLNMSFALTVDKIGSSDNFGNDLTSDINNVFFRIGYEKRRALSKRFVYGLGIDLVLESTKNETVNEDNFGGGSVTTITTRSGWGLGPRATFSYRISDKIFIGTEANYYFKSLNEEFEVDFSGGSGNDDSQENDVKQLRFSSPAILWLSFRI